MCLLLILLMMGPRAALFGYWLVWPARWDAAFDSFFVAAFGVILVPWTTLMYVITAPGGVEGFDYALIAGGLIVDVASWLGSSGRAYSSRGVQTA